MKKPFSFMTQMKVCDLQHVSILSHQPPHNSHCCSSRVSLILHDPITFQDVREEDGCTWENNPPTSRCGISISCHERKATKGSEFTWGKYENIQSVQEAHECHGHITEHIFQHQCVSFTGGNLKTTFVFVLHVWAFKTALSLQWHTNLPFKFFLRWHQAYDPLPPHPCHPKHNAIFQGNWVNQQWKQEELIIPQNLLSVIF